jgi:hypothetical protein
MRNARVGLHPESAGSVTLYKLTRGTKSLDFGVCLIIKDSAEQRMVFFLGRICRDNERARLFLQHSFCVPGKFELKVFESRGCARYHLSFRLKIMFPWYSCSKKGGNRYHLKGGKRRGAMQEAKNAVYGNRSELLPDEFSSHVMSLSFIHTLRI